MEIENARDWTCHRGCNFSAAPPEPTELGDDKDTTALEIDGVSCEFGPLGDGGTWKDGLGGDAVWLGMET